VIGAYYAIGRAWRSASLAIRDGIFRLRHGYSFVDCWSLDSALAKWIAPRLEHLRDNHISHVCDLSTEEWFAVLDKMAQTFRFISAGEWWYSENRDQEAYVNEGLDLFREFYFGLWD
jgi:hypothetical protein